MKTLPKTIKTIQNLIETNIIFCSVILEILKKKIKKFINFGSMMEYSYRNHFSPKNFYAVTKFSFQKVEEFYKKCNPKIVVNVLFSIQKRFKVWFILPKI